MGFRVITLLFGFFVIVSSLFSGSLRSCAVLYIFVLICSSGVHKLIVIGLIGFFLFFSVLYSIFEPVIIRLAVTFLFIFTMPASAADSAI